MWVQKPVAGGCCRGGLRHPLPVDASPSCRGGGQSRRPTTPINPTPTSLRRYEIFNVARWVNNSLVSERETRGQQRSFVRYTDLFEDWRPAVAKVADELGLRLSGDLTPGHHHPVDDFIDPDLRRVRVTWDDLEIPTELKAIADGVWDALDALWVGGGASATASASLDDLSGRYERLFLDATAISHDALEEAVAVAEAAGAAAERAKLSSASAVKEPAQSPHSKKSERRVDDLGGRELLAEAGRRLDARLRSGRKRHE